MTALSQQIAIATETIYLKPGQPPGFCLQASLFYRSETWFNVLQRDVNDLLNAFVQAYEHPIDVASAPVASTSGVRLGEEVGDAEVEKDKVDVNTLSPFEVFKAIWIRLGWTKIHLFASLDGPLRKAWGESVMRAFLHHLHGDEAPLIQTASLFALYLFYLSQAKAMERTFIMVDPPTLSYIIGDLPKITCACFVQSLDPSLLGSPASHTASPPYVTTAPLPFRDVTTVLQSLFSVSAFSIIPSELYLFPKVPSVWIKDAKYEKRQETGTLVLGAEAEMRAMQQGNVDFAPLDDGSLRLVVVDDDNLDWATSLRARELDYLATKEDMFPRGELPPVLTTKVLEVAKSISLAKLKDVTGATTGGDVEVALGIHQSGPDAIDVGGYDLMDLVGESSRGGGVRHGLDVVEHTFSELRNEAWKKRSAEQAGIDGTEDS